MARRAPFYLVIFGIVASLGAIPAHADEAYVCDAGRLVYVKHGDLEKMKLSDPCIASYYGLPFPPAPKTAAKDTEPLPATTGKAKVSFNAGPESGSNPGQPKRRAGTPTQIATPQQAPIAAQDTDFRNVHVINASPGEDEWFHPAK